jgi:hypothetical protein
MLIKILPDQLDKYWPYLKYACEDTFSPEVLTRPGIMANILENLLLETAQAWICVVDDMRIVGCVITTFFGDDITKSKYLRVLCLYGYDDVPKTEWIPGFETLCAYAKASGCTGIDAFTKHKLMLKLADHIGFAIDTHIWKDL